MKVVADILQGFWFSAHEQWKVMEMPYYDVDLVKYVSHSFEQASSADF